MQSPSRIEGITHQEVTMNEFKRCIRVFSHSPFKVRLMLLNMICDIINGKPQQNDKPSR
jgi:hypothetical protein